MIKIKDINEKVLENILIILILISAVKKGGFYISDMNVISILIILVSFIFFIVKLKDKQIKINHLHILLAMFSISYLFPIIFNKDVDRNFAIWETIKYITMFCIYFVVTNSRNKERYEYLVIFIGVIISIFGIDGIADRIFKNFLGIFGSGYLSTYLDRLSSFIQYANTCSILLMVSFLFSLKHLYVTSLNVQENYNKSTSKKFKMLFLTSSFLLMCILLTQSRLPIALTIIGIILINITKKENRYINIILTIILSIISIIFSSYMMEYVYINKSLIYLIFAIYMIADIIICNLSFSFIVMNIKFWYIMDNFLKNKKRVWILSFIFFIVFTLILFIPKKLVISQNDNNLCMQREINFVEVDELQKFNIMVDHITDECEYKIEIYEKRWDNTEHLVASFKNIEKHRDNLGVSLRPNIDSKNYIVKFYCMKRKS